jgi:flagellar hook assembly protein FlgD
VNAIIKKMSKYSNQIKGLIKGEENEYQQGIEYYDENGKLVRQSILGPPIDEYTPV